MTHHSRLTIHVKEILASGLALFLLMNLIQSRNIFHLLSSHLVYTVFLFISILYIGIWCFVSIKDYIHNRGIFYGTVQEFNSLRIHKRAKMMLVLVFSINLMAIAVGMARYPFYDVGMFRWSTDFSNKDKIVYLPKYYYWENGKYKIVDLRKETSVFLAEYLGWGYTQEFTFGATYHYKGEKGNFEFLSHAMKDRGVDTLWVGIHSVNYETREVKFDPDLCNAIKINQTPNLYYGPIYIPEYQMMKCVERGSN